MPVKIRITRRTLIFCHESDDAGFCLWWAKKGWDLRRASNLGKWPEMIQGPKIKQYNR